MSEPKPPRPPVLPGKAPQHIPGPPDTDKLKQPGESEREKRAARAQAVNAVLASEFRNMVQASLETRYHQDTFAEMQMGSLFMTHNNVMADVLDRVATAYPSARYYLQRNGAEVEDENFTRMMELLDYDSLGANLDRLGLVHPGVVVHPTVVFDEDSGKRKLEHLVLTPGEFDLKRSRHNSASFSQFTHFYTDPETGYACKVEWTSQAWELYHKSGTGPGGTEWSKMDEGVHPFGCVPVLYYRLHSDQLWSTNYGKDLVDTTVEVNAAESVMAYMMPGQVKTVLGQATHWPPGQVARHIGVLEAGDNSSVQMVDWQLDLAAFSEQFIKRPRRTIAVRMGLPGDEWDVGVPPSGEALRMRYAERDSRANKRKRNLSRAMRKLYWLDLATLFWNLGRPTKMHGGERVLPIDGFDGGWAARKGLNPDGVPEAFTPPAPATVMPPFDPALPWSAQEVQFGLDIADTTYPLNQTEREARDRFRLEMGLTNQGELLLEENPDADKPLDTIRRNLALTRGFRQTMAVGRPGAPPVKVGAPAPGAPGKPPPKTAPGPDNQNEEE